MPTLDAPLTPTTRAPLARTAPRAGRGLWWAWLLSSVALGLHLLVELAK